MGKKSKAANKEEKVKKNVPKPGPSVKELRKLGHHPGPECGQNGLDESRAMPPPDTHDRPQGRQPDVNQELGMRLR